MEEEKWYIRLFFLYFSNIYTLFNTIHTMHFSFLFNNIAPHTACISKLALSLLDSLMEISSTPSSASPTDFPHMIGFLHSILTVLV